MLTGGKNVIPHAVRDVADAAAAFSARIGPDRHFDSQEKVEEALAECCSPQNVTVIGMTGSGKSSTLDALAGERFCSRVSSEATLVRWQYRPHPAPHTHEWVLDLFYPSDALLNLEFWDTIGLEQEDAPRKLSTSFPNRMPSLWLFPPVTATIPSCGTISRRWRNVSIPAWFSSSPMRSCSLLRGFNP